MSELPTTHNFKLKQLTLLKPCTHCKNPKIALKDSPSCEFYVTGGLLSRYCKDCMKAYRKNQHQQRQAKEAHSKIAVTAQKPKIVQTYMENGLRVTKLAPAAAAWSFSDISMKGVAI